MSFYYRISESKFRVSAFLLCLVSPVLHKLLCGQFKERASKEIELLETEALEFQLMIDLACGHEIKDNGHASTLIKVAELADRYELIEVVSMLDDLLPERVTTEMCAEVLGKGPVGLHRVSETAQQIALMNFETWAKTEGFLKTGPKELATLLEDDDLNAVSEEFVFEAVLHWMQGCTSFRQGQELVEKIRFPLMATDYLVNIAESGFANLYNAKGCALEAIHLKQQPAYIMNDCVFQYLGSKSFLPRKRTGVPWKEFENGGEKRLGGNFMETLCIVECDGKICSGDLDGSIRIWNKNTLLLEKVFFLEQSSSIEEVEDESQLSPWCDCLTDFHGQLVSGHEGGRIGLWDLRNERCSHVLEGHTSHVRALAVIGNKLISASDDCTIKVWGKDSRDDWLCEQTLRGHHDSVKCLTILGNNLISGSSDSTIRVWNVIDGNCYQRLFGHKGRVTALLIHDSKLFSSATDRTLRVWSTKSWSVVRVLDSILTGDLQHIQSLAISGNNLVIGSASALHLSEQQRNENECDVRVLNMETFECEYSFRQPVGQDVLALVGTAGQVWAGVGREIVVWAVTL